MAEKIYVGKARYITFRDGGEKCRIWLTPEGVENINKNVDNNGSINLVMVEMRDPDRAGNTHTLYVDDWKPDGQRRSHAPGRSRGERTPQERPERPRQDRSRDDGGFNAYGAGGRYTRNDAYSPDDVPEAPENTDIPDDDIPF